jgi:hypothetical protein
MFANTGVSNFCGKGCLRCTKDFDCLYGESAGKDHGQPNRKSKDSQLLIGFAIVDTCPNNYSTDPKNSNDRTCYDGSKKSLQFGDLVKVNDSDDSKDWVLGQETINLFLTFYPKNSDPTLVKDVKLSFDFDLKDGCIESFEALGYTVSS